MGIGHTWNQKGAIPCQVILLTDVYGQKCGYITRKNAENYLEFLEKNVLFNKLECTQNPSNSILELFREPNMQAFLVDDSLWEEEKLQLGNDTLTSSPIQVTPYQLKQYLQAFHYPIHSVHVEEPKIEKPVQLQIRRNK